MSNARQVSNRAPAPAPTNSVPATQPQQRASLVRMFAAKYSVDPDKLMGTLKDTAFKQPQKDGKPGPEVSDAQMMALLVVAQEYGLNPFTRDIYAFPAKGGGIVPIVSVDGWIRIINQRPELQSIEFEYPPEGTDKADWWTGCTITRSDRTVPLTVREYYAECYRDTDPWNQMGRRMLRHKALIQCARVAFGYGGIYDPDEGERIADSMAIDSTATEVPHGKPMTREPQPKRIEQQSAPPAEITLESVKRLADKVGVPETEVFAFFEIGGWDELTAPMQQQASEWLSGIHGRQP